MYGKTDGKGSTGSILIVITFLSSSHVETSGLTIVFNYEGATINYEGATINYEGATICFWR